jgi:hypothetical protein
MGVEPPWAQKASPTPEVTDAPSTADHYRSASGIIKALALRHVEQDHRNVKRRTWLAKGYGIQTPDPLKYQNDLAVRQAG